ncbi:MAG: T9SS type A sorting domain-containing protein [Bacteroidales bacterium]|nr:T9SS type A sorting domain-containing protein [Bacteroidales bacterium]
MTTGLNFKRFGWIILLALFSVVIKPIMAMEITDEIVTPLLHSGESAGGSALSAVVTCNISLTTGGDPSGTVLNFTGQEFPFNSYTQTATETGIVIFPEIIEGEYLLQAHKTGFEVYELLADINSNTVIDIQLQELRQKPLNLSVDSLSLIAEWEQPREILVNENFEGVVFPPNGWQALSQNFTGWYATTDGSSELFIIPPHSTYAVVSDEVDNGNGCCDYLILPEMNLTNHTTHKLNFACFYNGAYSQLAYIEISTDGGTNWEMIYMVPPFPYGWQNIEVDLSQYSGQNGLNNVLLAFHADDVGHWASGWAVDDVVIASATVPVLSYALFLDEEFVDSTSDTTYTFQNLVYGQEYLAGVSALYSSGYSEQDTIRFVNGFLSPPLDFQGTIPVMTDYAQLWWNEPYNFINPGITVPGLSGYNIYRNNILIAYVEFPDAFYYDLNLIPGFHTYEITAVYDLTEYGFPGETGESMTEGPVDLAFICCGELPFIENFNTGLFETNQWTVDPGNWRISGLNGNEAPSAEFYNSPDTLDYSQSLTSFFMIGTDIIDGIILVDFDLKHTLLNPTGNEFLAVEAFDGSSWIKVAEYSNVNSFDWLRKSVIISNQAKGNIFNIRFRAHGANSLDILNWMVDNIQVYRKCPPPANLIADVNFPHVDEIRLAWEAPVMSNSRWLAWDDGYNHDAVGLTGGGSFSVASRFTPAQLQQVYGSSLTRIRFFPYEGGGTIFLKVWRGSNAAELIHMQPIAAFVAGEWNEIPLNMPVMVPVNEELWIGYTVSHGDEQFIAGTDAGPAVAGFGDLISLDGLEWESMATAYALNYNWNLQGYFEYAGKQTQLLPISDNSVYGPPSEPVQGHLPPLQHAELSNSPDNTSREFIGYNIWLDGLFLASTTETIYYDDSMEIGDQPCYTVTAVYGDCESEHTNQACIYIDNINSNYESEIQIYPNPSNNVVNIMLTNHISQLVVYNFVGQVVYEQVITKDKSIQLNVRNYEAGAYLIKFITSSGESFTKKVAVTH